MAAIAQRVVGIALFRALQHRPFALLWSGQTLSRVGDYLYELALAWWVLQKTGSAVAVGAVLIFSFTPMLLFLLIGGVAVDRFPRVRLMLASDLLRGVVVAAVAALAFTGFLDIWHVYLASLVFGFVDAFFQPAYTALVPQITPSESLLSANSLTSMSTQAGRVLGPALAGAIIGLGGTPSAFALDSLSFFLSAALLWPLLRLPAPAMTAPETEDGPEAARGSSVLRDVREGISTVLSSPWLWVGISVFSLTNVALAGPYSVAMPFLVKDFMHADAGTLGLLYAIFPIGYLIGGVWAGRKTRVRRRGLTAYLCGMLAGLMLAVFGLPVPVFVLIIAALLNGAALEVANLIWTTTLQELVPADKLGRVASIDMLGSFALLPVGFALAGWATDLIGPANVFLLGGGLAALLAGLALAHPAIRGLD